MFTAQLPQMTRSSSSEIPLGPLHFVMWSKLGSRSHPRIDTSAGDSHYLSAHQSGLHIDLKLSALDSEDLKKTRQAYSFHLEQCFQLECISTSVQGGRQSTAKFLSQRHSLVLVTYVKQENVV